MPTIIEKAFNISNVRIDNDFLVLTVDNQLISLRLSDISKRLENASGQEREIIKISPSGYGLHWPLLDEDLSVNGLLKQFEANRLLQQTV